MILMTTILRTTKPIQLNDHKDEEEDGDEDEDEDDDEADYDDANKKVDSEVNLPPAVHPDEHFLAKPIM